MPHILALTDTVILVCKSSILYQIQETAVEPKVFSDIDNLILDEVICLSGASWAKEASLISLLPSSVRSVLDKWKDIKILHIPLVNFKVMF